MDEEEIRAELRELPVPDVAWFPTLDSTNAYALDWAARGALDGSLVAADEQKSGRGRLSRKWVTNPGSALAFSLILRPTAAEREQASLFSPLGALGVASAFRALGLSPQIKWPNDVLLLGLKVCGVLAESVWMGDGLDALVLGIGVNVAPTSVPPAEELLFPAGCVETVLGQPVRRTRLLAEILRSIFSWRARLGAPEFLQAWQSQLAFSGETVRVALGQGESMTGVLLGVDSRGALRLRLADGNISTLLAGDVSLRPLGMER